jgi:hypothetical protein
VQGWPPFKRESPQFFAPFVPFCGNLTAAFRFKPCASVLIAPASGGSEFQPGKRRKRRKRS